MSSVAPSLDWLSLGRALFGGLALFLADLELLSEGWKKAAGQALRTALGKLTTNRFMGALIGAFVTDVLNSSSVTTVPVVGFVTAGVMTLAQSVGVIMGANIGSIVTALLAALGKPTEAVRAAVVHLAFNVLRGGPEQLHLHRLHRRVRPARRRGGRAGGGDPGVPGAAHGPGRAAARALPGRLRRVGSRQWAAAGCAFIDRLRAATSSAGS